MSKAKYLAFYENWRMNKEWCTPEEWYELEDLILQLRFDGIDTKVEDIKNPKLQMIWNNIRPSLLKSNRDKKYNDNKKSALQEVTSTEFDLPKEENQEIGDLSPQNIQDDISVHQEEDMQPESLIEPFNEELEDNNINDFENNTETMGNLTNIVIVDGKAMIKEPAIETRSMQPTKTYTTKEKEDIKQKIIEKKTIQIPRVEIPTTTLVDKVNEIIKEHRYEINEIIKSRNSALRVNRDIQAPENLKILLNKGENKYYSEQIIAYINSKIDKKEDQF